MPEKLKNKAFVTIGNEGKWQVIVGKDDISIGCKTKDKASWEKFFGDKNFIDTDPRLCPVEYKLIEDDFRKAMEFQNRYFKENGSPTA